VPRRWPPLPFAAAVGRPVRGYSGVWVLLVAVPLHSLPLVVSGLASPSSRTQLARTRQGVAPLSLPMLPFDGDVAGGSVAGLEPAAPGQTGACAVVLLGLYFRAIAGFRSKAQP